eukprot:gene3303-5744_t
MNLEPLRADIITRVAEQFPEIETIVFKEYPFKIEKKHEEALKSFYCLKIFSFPFVDPFEKSTKIFQEIINNNPNLEYVQIQETPKVQNYTWDFEKVIDWIPDSVFESLKSLFLLTKLDIKYELSKSNEKLVGELIESNRLQEISININFKYSPFFSALLKNTSLESISFTDYHSCKDLKCLEFLEVNKSLKRLSIKKIEFKDDFDNYFNEKMAKNVSIEELTSGSHSFDFLKTNKVLHLLTVSNGINSLTSNISKNSTLKTLIVDTDNFDGEFLDVLKTHHSIVSLDFRFPEDSEELIDFLEKNKTIQKLRFCELYQEIEPVHPDSNLNDLSISFDYLDMSVFKDIKFQSLEVMDSNIVEDSFSCLNFEYLRKLDISRTDVGNKGLKNIANAPMLEDLSIDDFSLFDTKAALLFFESLEILSTLKKLRLRDMNNEIMDEVFHWLETNNSVEYFDCSKGGNENPNFVKGLSTLLSINNTITEIRIDDYNFPNYFDQIDFSMIENGLEQNTSIFKCHIGGMESMGSRRIMKILQRNKKFLASQKSINLLKFDDLNFKFE